MKPDKQVCELAYSSDCVYVLFKMLCRVVLFSCMLDFQEETSLFCVDERVTLLFCGWMREAIPESQQQMNSLFDKISEPHLIANENKVCGRCYKV